MSIRKLTPLIALCATASRIRVKLAECGGCDPDVTVLILTPSGCDTYEEVCIEAPVASRGCGTPNMPTCQQIVTRKVPRASLSYPLHEIDGDGYAVFVLDGKLLALGFGRYGAQVISADMAPYQFDIDFIPGKVSAGIIAVDDAQCRRVM